MKFECIQTFVIFRYNANILFDKSSMDISPAKVTKENLITLNLKWFSILSEHRGKRSEKVQLKSGITGGELIDHLAKEFPLLEKYRAHVRLAVNREYAEPGTILNDGDEVAFITPVSGG